MALRALQGPTGGGAPVGTLGGTTNTIPRWTGATTLGDSGLIDDGTQVYTTTRKVGFGTAAPIARTHVNAGGVAQLGAVTVRINTAITEDQTTYRGLYLGWDTAGQTGVIAPSTAAVGSNLAFWTFSGTAWGERARIDSSGVLCVNTTNVRTSRLSLEQTGTGTKMATFSNAVDADFEIKSTSAGLLTIGTGTGTLLVQSGGTERIRVSNSGAASASQVAIGTSSFTAGCSLTVAQSIDASQSGQGLKLPATPGNADTQTLDAYQENTWTPTLVLGTPGTSSWAYTSQTGRVTRVGRLVFCSFEVKATLTLGTGTGELYVAGLPATAAGITDQMGGAITYSNAFATAPVALLVKQSTTTAYVMKTSAANMAATDLVDATSYTVRGVITFTV